VRNHFIGHHPAQPGERYTGAEGSMEPPRPGDRFQLGETTEVLEIDLLEWGASRRPETPTRPEFYVARTREGDRYVLVPLERSMVDVRWRGIPLRAR
jgi:hypothetical protein